MIYQTRELEAREAELRMREQQIEAQKGTAQPSLSPTWPPFYPILRHEISSDIPSAYQAIAWQSFRAWQVLTGGYAMNLAAGVYAFIRGGQGIFGLALDLLYLFLFPALALCTWHMSLYKALQLNSGLWYGAYFISASLQLILSALLVLGFIGGSAGGIFGTLAAVATGKLITALLAGACTALSVLTVLAGVYMIQAVGRAYWNRGETAKEISRAAMGNPPVIQYALNNIA